jgi:PKD repeat protein
VNYSDPGTYTAVLTLDLLFGIGPDTVTLVRKDSVPDLITVHDSVSAEFIAFGDTVECKNPFQQFQVLFKATKPGLVDSLVWEWGDGTRFVDSADTPIIPVHAYFQPGQYDVTLKAYGYGPCGFDSVTHPNMITLATAIQNDSVSWTVNPATGDTAQDFLFINLTNGFTSLVEWDFTSAGGDTLTGDTVTFNFENPGTFPIGLRVGNVCNEIDTTFDVVVTATGGVSRPPGQATRK